MTAPRHHPSDAMLVDLARGALQSGRALVVQAHLGACRECRASVRVMEAVGGVLLDSQEPAILAPDALERALASLDRAEARQAPPPEPRGDWIKVPTEVTLAAGRKRWAAPGVWVANVTGRSGSGPRSYLLRVGAGMAVPRHTHKGEEFICVLKGAFEDRGVIYGPGDFAESDESVEHRPQVTRDGECVCLAAADNGLVPRDLVGWLFQPFVSI